MKPLLTFYGDDLTGSTDAMEALAGAGLRTVLFLSPPTAAQWDRLAAGGLPQAVGLAGTSRSETPRWMAQHLPGALQWLRGVGAPLCHYKVCSTFDSAPTVGNIGRALEIGLEVFEQSAAPLVVGVPQLRRYTVFGQHFAAYQGEVHRLDRHPVMREHPVTPMDEADLRRHLARQTELPVRLVDWLALQAPDADALVDAAMTPLAASRRHAVLFDVADLATQAGVGRQLWRLRNESGGCFVVGSSGVEYALVQAWRSQGLLPAQPPAPPAVREVRQLAAVSGSCSATTARQIRWAERQAGFALVRVDPARLACETHGEAELEAALATARRLLDEGRSVIACTALGPQDARPAPADAQPHALGRRMGRLLRAMVAHGKLERAVVAGGDTSSHALRELDVHGLTVAMPLPQTPGSPLCTAHSENAAFDGLQVALKGGQIGADDYFEAIRRSTG